MTNSLPQRKQIRLKDYDYSQNGAYFITICTHNREMLFGEIETDAIVGAHLCVRPNRPDELIKKWLFELQNKYENVKIDKYVIMPDHIHFVLFNIGDDEETGAHTGAPLPEMVKWLKTQTTNEYIKGVKAVCSHRLRTIFGREISTTTLLETSKITRKFVNT